MKFLVAGFEPFGGSTINPSAQAAQALDGQVIGGARLAGTVLPVDGQLGPRRMLEALHDCRPDGVVCLGEASERAVLSIERVAINLRDYRIPDNSGRQVVDEPVVPGGPAAYFATLPVRKILQALLEAGIPAELSLSAGTYLCNQVMYHLLHDLAVNERKIPAGFIHLPALPQQAAGAPRPQPSMGLETTLAGIRTAIAVMTGQG
jgi:pyroglutamyl-peptidase